MYRPFAVTFNHSRDPLLGESSLVCSPLLRLDLLRHLLYIKHWLVVGHSLIGDALLSFKGASFCRRVSDRKVICLAIVFLARILEEVLIHALNHIALRHKLLFTSLVVALALIRPRLDRLFPRFIQRCVPLVGRVSSCLDFLRSPLFLWLEYVDGVSLFMDATLALEDLRLSLRGAVD